MASHWACASVATKYDEHAESASRLFINVLQTIGRFDAESPYKPATNNNNDVAKQYYTCRTLLQWPHPSSDEELVE